MTSKSQSIPINMKFDLTDVNAEPTDEQLSQLMKEVAEEAKEKSEKANQKFFHEMNEYIKQQKEKFSNRTNKKGHA